MKILIVNISYNLGSTGKISFNMADDFIKAGNEVKVICHESGKCQEKVTVHEVTDSFTRFLTRVMERITGLTGCFSNVATDRALKIIKGYNPDVVYLGNLHGCYINIYRLYKYLRKNNKPTVQIMWDEYPMTGSCTFSFECNKFQRRCAKCPIIHTEYPKSIIFDTSTILQRKKRNAYNFSQIAFVAVPYTANRAQKATVLAGKKVYHLDEAINQYVLFYPRDTFELRKELRISDSSKIIVSVCVYPSVRKGGKYFLQLARECFDLKDTVFVHVGFGGDRSECPENYIPISVVYDQNLLAKYYSLGDLFICPSLAETQPSSCLEAVSCGTPICGFNVSGIPTCADYPFGKYVEFEDIKAMKDVVINTPRKSAESIKAVREYAESRFSSHLYSKKLLEIGHNLIKH